MITPAEIRKKALKLWDNQAFLRARMKGEPFFPLFIPFHKVGAREALEDFASVREWLRILRDGSKERKGFGYSVEFNEVNHRQLGTQAFPSRIVIESPEDFLRLIGKTQDYERFKELVELILSGQPALEPWLERHPASVLEHRPEWAQLLKVCLFFQQNPRPGRYVRELDIPGVDTKFIEQHKSIISSLLDLVLPPEAMDAGVSGSSGHGFERRYGLRYDEPLIRFRLLDEALMDAMRLTDISTPLSRFRELSLPCERIFITENKINGLSFPPVKNSIIIFGLGYGIQSLQNIEWLENKKIHYWGDLDTHGFAMLSQLRSYYPRTESFLMDRETLLAFRKLWGTEPTDKRCIAELPNLNDEERQLYEELRDNVVGENVRLEQERIGFQCLCERLRE